MSALFDLGQRITMRDGNRGNVAGRVVEIVIPEPGIPGYSRVGRVGPVNSASGGYCLEHRRPAPPYEGAPHIAPTLPHYTVITPEDAAVQRCACQVVTASKEVTLFDLEPQDSGPEPVTGRNTP